MDHKSSKKVGRGEVDSYIGIHDSYGVLLLNLTDFFQLQVEGWSISIVNHKMTIISCTACFFSNSNHSQGKKKKMTIIEIFIHGKLQVLLLQLYDNEHTHG